MSTITIPRADVTTAQVSEALRQGLSPRYHVLPGLGVAEDPPLARDRIPVDTILVGTGSNRVFRVEVTISRHSGQTFIDLHPGGLPGAWPGGLKLINRLWITRKARYVLQAAPSLR